MADKKDLKVNDQVKHRFREWYQQCVVTEIEDGCNGGIKVLCQDSPIYNIGTDHKAGIKGFAESSATFCPQDLAKVKF